MPLRSNGRSTVWKTHMTVEHRTGRPAELDDEELYADGLLEEDRNTEREINVDEFLTQVEPAEKRHKRQKRLMYHMTQANTQTANATYEELAKAPVAGVIKSVKLENFMCHSNFELTFGPRLNFIVGRNGSGKSSILTAISVCLGAKATETNRGSSLKDLIKEGEKFSRVRVTLTNVGDDAYEPHKYGASITIERTIKKDGTPSVPYILRSETGKKVSSKKSDLDAILDTFRIAVNNPMTFLSQDQARSFLTASSDADKYKHFMRGTLMEEMIENLKKVQDTIEQIESKLIRLTDNTKDLKEQSTAAKQLHSRLRESEELRSRQVRFHAKYFWLEYSHAQEVLEKSEADIKYLQDYISESEEKIDEIKQSISLAEQKKTVLENKLEKFSIEVNTTKEEYTNQKNATREATNRVENLSQKLEDLQRTIADLGIQVEKIDRDAKKEEDKIREKNGGSKDHLKRELEQLETEDASLDESIAGWRREQGEIDERSRETFTEMEAELNDKKSRLADLQNQIQMMQSSSREKNPLAPFNENTKRVVAAMRRTQFQDKVIGPLGVHVAVKPEYEKWTRIIEAGLANNLNTFVVRNIGDQRRLKDLLYKNHCDSTILIRRPEKFDYSNGIPRGYLSILDCIEINDEDVLYALIDLVHIESSALCNDRKDAQHAVETVRNLRSAYCPGNRNGECLRQFKNTNGAFLSDVLYFNNIPKLSVKNAANDPAPLRQSYREIQEDYRQLQHQKETSMKTNNHQKQLLATQIKNGGTRKRDIGKRKYQIARTLDDASDSARLNELLREKAELTGKRTVYMNSIDSLKDDMDKAQQRAGAHDVRLAELKERGMGIKQLMVKASEEKVDLMADITMLQQKIDHRNRECEHHKNSIREREVNVPQWQRKADESRDHAQRLCSKEEADTVNINDLKTLQREIERIAREVDRADGVLGKSPAEIVEADEIARSNYAAAFRLYKQTREAQHLLKQSLDSRMHAFRESRANATSGAELDFNESLQFRNFNGSLNFDFTKRTLKMMVRTKNDKNARHVDSLSGGEKSFSQIALLLATWKVMKSRIKALDEFDVFMDQVNRKIGMRLMLTKLSEEVKAQTIFITPQDVSQMAELDQDSVKIHKMHDPRP